MCKGTVLHHVVTPEVTNDYAKPHVLSLSLSSMWQL